MADANDANFSKRLGLIEKNHRQMSRGYIQMVERNGILVPKHRRALRRKFPLRGLAMAFALFLIFKAVLLVQLGNSIYAERVETLSTGSVAEQIGAWVMSADPISIWIAAQAQSWM